MKIIIVNDNDTVLATLQSDEHGQEPGPAAIERIKEAILFADSLLYDADSPPNYEVVVGNIGTVYSGPSQVKAAADHKEYVDQSRTGYGRASGESVTTFIDGEIFEHYEGNTESN